MNNASYYYIGALTTSVASPVPQAILIVSGVVLLISIMVIVPLVYKVKQNQDRILRIFVQIPEPTVMKLIERVEGFITSLQVGEEDEGDSEMDIMAQDDDLESRFLSRKKKRRFKSSS
jgi:hypothetical protein